MNQNVKPDEWVEAHTEDLESQNKLAHRAMLDGIDIQDRLDKLEQRYQFPLRFFWLAVSWLVTTVVLIVLDGRCVLNISDSVILAMLGVALVKVFAPVLMFASYLFPKNKG